MSMPEAIVYCVIFETHPEKGSGPVDFDPAITPIAVFSIAELSNLICYSKIQFVHPVEQQT